MNYMNKKNITDFVNAVNYFSDIPAISLKFYENTYNESYFILTTDNPNFNPINGSDPCIVLHGKCES